MRLLLITATSPAIRHVRRARFLSFQQITMPYLAALAAPGWQVEHVDEEAEEIDFDAAVDLVGITFHTPSAGHAYDVAARFRARGVFVVAGGPHVTLLPQEAARHFDVIFVGEAERGWPRFLDDFAHGRAEKVYGPDGPQPLDGVPRSEKRLFHRRDHTGGVLFATRGCRRRCDFCTLAVTYGSGQRKRPVAEVAAEYASFPGKVIVFWDEDIAGDPEYAKALFRAIAPSRKWWSSQAGVDAGKDDELLELAARSGCKQLFLGLESVSQASLDAVHKRFNVVEAYRRIIDRVHAHGIAVQVGIVFGFDGDTPAVFPETVAFLEAAGVQNATFNLLTPFPGTPLFRRLEAEGRILTRDWERYNGRADVVFRPRHMTGEELLAGFRWANRRFYSIASIARRLRRSPVGLWWTLPLNLAYRARLRAARTGGEHMAARPAAGRRDTSETRGP